MNNNEELMKGVETYYGAGQISEVMANTITRIYQQANTQLPPEVKLNRMALDPFKINAQVALNKPVILSITIPVVNKFKVTTSLILPKNFPHTSTTWQISLDGNFDNPAVNIPSTTNTVVYSIPITKIDYETDYYFRVQHHSGALASPWSDIVKLTTAPPLPIQKPTILTGIQDEENEEIITLTASEFQHVDLLHTKSIWQASKQSNFSIIEHEVEDTIVPYTGTTLSIAEIESNKDYFFRVKYVSGKYSSAWSDGFLIHTLASETIEKPSVILDTPICPNSFIVGGSIFTPSNPEMLHTSTVYEIATSTDFETTSIFSVEKNNADELTTLQIPEATCNEGTEYFLRIKYKSELIESEWSDTVNTLTGFITVSKPKKTILPSIPLITGDSGYCKFMNVAGTIYGLFQDENNKFALGIYDTVTKTNTLRNTSSYTYTDDYMVTWDKDGIYLLLKHPTFYSIEKYNPTTNSWSTLTTTTSNLNVDMTISAFVATSKDFLIFHAAPYDEKNPQVPFVYTMINRTTLTWVPGPTFTGTLGDSAPYQGSSYVAVVVPYAGAENIFFMDRDNNKLQWLRYLNDELLFSYRDEVIWSNLDDEVVTTIEDILLDKRLVFIRRVYATYGESLQYTELLLEGELTDYVTLPDVPGAVDMDYPSFVLKDDDIYAIAMDKGRFLKPTIKSFEKGLAVVGPSANQVPKALFMEGDYVYALSSPEGHCPFTLIKISKTDPTDMSFVNIVFDNVNYIFASCFYYNGYIYFCGGSYYDEALSTTVLITKMYKYHVATQVLTIETESCPVFMEGCGCGYGDSLYFIGGYSTNPITALNPRKYNLTSKTWTLDLMNELTVQRNNMQLCPIPGQGIVCYNGRDIAFPNGLSTDQLMMHYLWNVDTNTLTELGQHGGSPDRPVMFLVNDVPTTIDYSSYEDHRFLMYQRDTVNGGYNFWKGIEHNYDYNYVNPHQSDKIYFALKDGNFLYVTDELLGFNTYSDKGTQTGIAIMKLDLVNNTYTVHQCSYYGYKLIIGLQDPTATKPYDELLFQLSFLFTDSGTTTYFFEPEVYDLFTYNKETDKIASYGLFDSTFSTALDADVTTIKISVMVGSKENSWSPWSDPIAFSSEIPLPP